MPIECAAYRVDGKPISPTNARLRDNAAYVGDLYEWEPGGPYRLKSRGTRGQLRLAKYLRTGSWCLKEKVQQALARAQQAVEANWAGRMHNLAQLGGAPLAEYTPKAARKKHQEAAGTTRSRLLPEANAGPLWKRVFHPVLMPRLQSFLWELHYKAVYHGDLLAKFAPTLRRCPRCNAESESLKHAFYHCPSVSPFWQQVGAALTGGGDRQITADKALAVDFRPRARVAPATFILPLACALWTVYRARTRAVFEPAQTSVHQMVMIWKHQVQEILMAKYKTSIKMCTDSDFRIKWSWLAQVVDCSWPAPTP